MHIQNSQCLVLIFRACFTRVLQSLLIQQATGGYQGRGINVLMNNLHWSWCTILHDQVVVHASRKLDDMVTEEKECDIVVREHVVTTNGHSLTWNSHEEPK